MKLKQFFKKGTKYFYAFTLILGLLMNNEMKAQNSTTVSGLISDSSGIPLTGVNIIEKGTKNSTSTDFDGKFSIKVANPNATLNISFIGFTSQDVNVAGRTSVTIKMHDEQETLKEVVVVGYGTAKKTDVTGSISTISSATITERNVINPLEAIQGSTPGVQITSSTGRSGDGYKVVIRGNNSLIAGAKPLYIVDGVPTDNIDFLNPQDIARMDVLKDASSAAIYGSRGASGVVIVTTKSGTSAKSGVSVSLESSYGSKTPVRLPQMMSGAEWWQYHQTAFLSATPLTQTPSDLSKLVLGNPITSQLLLDRANKGYNFDWYNAVLQTGMTSNNYINLSGRADNGLSYNMSFGIQKDEGILDKDTNDKYTFKLGVNHHINDKFTTGANLTMSRVETQLGSDLAMQDAFRFSPLMSPYAVDANGNETNQLFFLPGKLTYPNGSFAINKTSTVNPLLEIANSSQTQKSWNTIGNVFFQYQALDWLAFKTTFSAGVLNGVNSSAWGAQTDEGLVLKSGTGLNSASIKNTQNFNYTWDNQIDIKHTFNEVHNFSALLLQSIYSNTTENSYMFSNNQPFDVGTNNMGSGVQTSYQITSGYANNKLNSYAVRLNYAYKDKYILTASTRWDGASVLASAEQWASFPSVALAWNISKESFLDNNNIVSNLKLRASVGYTGNSNVQPYSSQALLDEQTYYANASNVVSGWQSKNLANAGITWEKTRETNLGLDFGFLANRITGSVDIYDRLSDKLIYLQQLPYETGYPNTFSNVGSVSNRGIEVGLTTKNIKSKLVDWETSFTFTKNENKLESIYNQDKVSDIGNNLILGSELNPNYNYVYDGVWQASQTAEAAKYGMLPGQAKPKDLNGDGKFDASDRTVIGNANPKWQGSIYSRLKVGQFDFNFSVLSSQGQTVLSSFHQAFTDVSARSFQKVPVDYYVPANGAGLPAHETNAYPTPGPATSTTGAGIYWVSNMAFYRDASYVKIKNISLGYTFEPELLKKIKMSNLRIYVNVVDPFVFTNFDGYDPEWASAKFGVNRPATVTSQLGLSVKF